MTSRRSFVRRFVGTATGTLALAAQASAARARPEPRSRREQSDRSTTTVTAYGNRTAGRAARLPGRLRPVVDRLDARLDAVSIDHCDEVGGTATVDDGRLVGGSAVATGDFSSDAIRRECRRRKTVARADRDGVERFLVGNDVAIAPLDGALVVGYAADGRDGALGRLAAALGAGVDRDSPSVRRPTGGLQSVLHGDAVVTADLGRGTRRALRTRLADAAGPFRTVVDAADEVGVAARIRSRTRTEVTYGVVAAPERLSIDAVRSVLREADTGPETVDDVRLDRSGRTVLVTATVPTDRFVDAHDAAFGLDGEDGDRD